MRAKAEQRGRAASRTPKATMQRSASANRTAPHPAIPTSAKIGDCTKVRRSRFRFRLAPQRLCAECAQPNHSECVRACVRVHAYAR